MWYQFAQNYNNPLLWRLMIPLAVVDLILRGFALWHSARREQKVWFVALLIVNSVGILPLIYLVFFKNGSSKAEKRKSKKK